MSEQRELSLAVALRWDGQGAPRVTAKGSGEIADRIIALAREHAVPLREDRALVGILSKVDLDQQIPARLYVAVAEVIAFAYALQGRSPLVRGAARADARPRHGAATPARSNAADAAD
jgi:flagellar biosynthesis protein